MPEIEVREPVGSHPAPRQALILFNPAAGRNPRRRAVQVQALLSELRAGGWNVEIAPISARGDACRATREAVATGRDVVIGCGGDGTLQQIAQALVETALAGGKAPLLAVAPPWGTANTFACTVRCPNRPRRAARWLLRAQPLMMPVGELQNADGRRWYFLSIGSAGYDAAIVHNVAGETKRRWGKLAFGYAAATLWRRYFPSPLEFNADGRAARADGLMLGLTRYYGGLMRLGRPGRDGALALALRGAPQLLPFQALALLNIGLQYAPGVERLPDAAPKAGIDIRTAGIPLEVDGEPAGFSPARLAHSSIRIAVLAK